MVKHTYSQELADSISALQKLVERWEENPSFRAQDQIAKIIKEGAQTLATTSLSVHVGPRGQLHMMQAIIRRGGPERDNGPSAALAEIDHALTDIVGRLRHAGAHTKLPETMVRELESALSGVARNAADLSDVVRRREFSLLDPSF